MAMMQEKKADLRREGGIADFPTTISNYRRRRFSSQRSRVRRARRCQKCSSVHGCSSVERLWQTAPALSIRSPFPGICRVYAQHQHDLFFAQGVVAAQDRLFQLDLWRRVGCGETAELFGEESLEGDRFARLLQYRGDATTPHNTRYNERFEQVHGASCRHVFDRSDWDLARVTSAPGQSGQPGSPHYDDLLPLGADARYFPLAYSRR